MNINQKLLKFPHRIMCIILEFLNYLSIYHEKKKKKNIKIIKVLLYCDVTLFILNMI